MDAPTIRTTQPEAASASVASTRPARAPIPGFHLGLAAAMTIIVLLGFWPFYSGLFTGAARAHPVIYVHAAVFSGWLVLLLAQTWLVFRRRAGAHRRLGRFGILYGTAILLSGIVTGFAAPALNVRNGTMTLDEAAGFLVLPIGDILLFGGFFIAGILARRQRESHRRLMILAAVALIFPGAARFAFDAGPLAILGLWLFPLVAAMVHDFWVEGRVHRLYWIGLAVLVVAFGRVGLMEAEAWLVIGRGILGIMLPAGV
jgi:hypothetical protein